MGRAWAVWVTACVMLAMPATAQAAGREAKQRRVSSEHSALVAVARAALPAVVSITTKEHADPSGEPQKGIKGIPSGAQETEDDCRARYAG